MRKIKDYPVSVLNVLQRYAAKKGENYQRVKTDTALIRFEDMDRTSNFFFEISKYQDVNGKFIFISKFRPANQDRTGEGNDSGVASSLDNVFNSWVATLEKYENMANPFEIPEPVDPIEQQYEDEYFAEFEIMDDDAETSSFSYAQQLRIDEYLGRVVFLLEEVKDSNNTEAIEEIKQNVSELRETQTQLTKREVVKKLSKIWAKARKAGIKVAKKVIDEAIKEGVKLLVKGTFDGTLIDKAHQIIL